MFALEMTGCTTVLLVSTGDPTVSTPVVLDAVRALRALIAQGMTSWTHAIMEHLTFKLEADRVAHVHCVLLGATTLGLEVTRAARVCFAQLEPMPLLDAALVRCVLLEATIRIPEVPRAAHARCALLGATALQQRVAHVRCALLEASIRTLEATPVAHVRHVMLEATTHSPGVGHA